MCTSAEALNEGSLFMLVAGPLILFAQLILVVSYNVVAEISWRLRDFQQATKARGTATAEETTRLRSATVPGVDWTFTSSSAAGDDDDGLEMGGVAMVGDELLDDPNARPNDPMRRVSVALNQLPPILFEFLGIAAL